MIWELRYRNSRGTDETSRHDDRAQACSALVGHLIDDAVTVADDLSMLQRNESAGDFKTEITAPDGTQIAYSIRELPIGTLNDPVRYLSLAQVADAIGVQPGSLSRYKLPEPDVIIGPVNDDGTLPRGTIRGWLPGTITAWNASRPGRGARTDITE